MENDIIFDSVRKTYVIPHERRNSIFSALSGLLSHQDNERFDVLQNISFTVERGEFFGIIGNNGSGKSTTLKLIAGIIRPDSGTVIINRKITPFLELGVGFNPDFTGIENIKLYGIILGLSKKVIESKIPDILEYSGLERFADTKLRNYSSGMQVRLAFSTAIQTNPEILLLDEVLAVGDQNFQKKCLESLTEFRKKNVTIVFVSHDLLAVKKYCDRVALIENGKIQTIGCPEQVIDYYQDELIKEMKDKY